MKAILNKLYEYQSLDKQEAYEALLSIGNGDCNHAHITGLLSAFLMRKPTIEEFKGFQQAMMELCLPIDLSDFDVIDIVGTGGDGKNTFNISTLSAFVVAGAGVHVAKHGNYAASSVSGSSNVLEYLGYRFTDSTDVLRQQLEEYRICFLHAPLFHPAMKRVASIRKDLGIRTFFNLLGPIINPAQPKKQLLGVSQLEYARIYNYLLQDTNQDYTIVHALDGYDEISLTGNFKVLTKNTEAIITPAALGLDTIQPHEISGGDTIEDAANIFIKVLKGNGTLAQKQVVIANSGYAIHCAKPEISLADSLVMAAESLQSQKAYNIFKNLTNSQS